MAAVDLRERIRDIPDFPKPGIVFKDITPLLLDPAAMDYAVRELAGWARERDVELVVAAEARGFILGAAIARELGVGFVPARKPGKLPHETVSAEYMLEYGVDTLELHADALAHGTRVLVHDDLIATGGTARAVCDLVERLGGVVAGAPSSSSWPSWPGARSWRSSTSTPSSPTTTGDAVPTTKRQRTIGAPPEAVWRVVGDANHLPRWWPRVRRVEAVSEAGWTKVFMTGKGRPVRADYTLLETEPPRAISWSQELEDSPFERLMDEAVTEVRLAPAARRRATGPT